MRLNPVTNRTVLAAVFLSVFVAACKNDPTVTDMLTADDWKMTTLTVNPAVIVNNVAITDYYSQLYDYDKDNTLRFRTDGTFVSDEGSLKENPNDPQTRQGNWLLSTSEDHITVWTEEDTISYDLISITEGALTLSYSQRDTATQINYTLTAGFVHP